MSHRTTLNGYLNELAARCPTPGGGSAAALVGAIGVSLLSMAAVYMRKKTGSAALTSKLKKVIRFTGRSQKRLERLMIEDEKAYLRLSQGRKKCSAVGMMRLFKRAAEVPMEVCEILSEGLKLCEGLTAHCKKSLISDLVEAAIIMEAGSLSAKANVDVNLTGITDAPYVRRARRKLAKLVGMSSKTKKRVLKRCRRP